MIRKILISASLGGLLLAGTPGMLQSRQNPPRQQPGQQPPGQQPPAQQPPQEQTQSVTGKVTDIGDQGHSFTVNASNGQSMKFLVDKNTQVRGQVKIGTTVAVDYTAMGGGQFLCLRVAAQQS
ncbi:MAG TPA: hypothetical protein VMH31_08170 [Methylomirabilota bacterium]|nr:hypothetical protein [Methylomirabilota bacterium]